MASPSLATAPPRSWEEPPELTAPLRTSQEVALQLDAAQEWCAAAQEREEAERTRRELAELRLQQAEQRADELAALVQREVKARAGMEAEIRTVQEREAAVQRDEERWRLERQALEQVATEAHEAKSVAKKVVSRADEVAIQWQTQCATEKARADRLEETAAALAKDAEAARAELARVNAQTKQVTAAEDKARIQAEAAAAATRRKLEGEVVSTARRLAAAEEELAAARQRERAEEQSAAGYEDTLRAVRAELEVSSP